VSAFCIANIGERYRDDHKAAKSTARLKTISPKFVVPDVITAAEYYRDVLGFQILGYFSEPPVYSIVRRDSVEIHLGKADANADASAAPNTPHREDSIDAYIRVDHVDALFEELKSSGATIIEQPTVREYHCYEMVVEDKFGFRLAFGMDIPEQR
jgi:uncharacterized glyoxalase superfamily protein PhnB